MPDSPARRRVRLTPLGEVLVFIVATIGLLVVAGIVAYFLHDHRNEPFCHKFLMLELWVWTGKTQDKEFPNANGRSTDSMRAMPDFLGYEPWEVNYRYVPGLRQTDLGDLVLAYMVEPTRYIFHNHPQTFSAERKWLLIPVDFAQGQRMLSETGECCERVSLDQLKSRLKKTLDYLQQNDPPPLANRSRGAHGRARPHSTCRQISRDPAPRVHRLIG